MVGLIAAAALSRLLPHPANVSPVAALALLGGATLPLPWSVALPAAAMLLSDIFLGFDSIPVTLSVYGSFFATVALGRWLKARPSPVRLIAASLGSSVLFYLVTNAAVWQFSGLYPRTPDGLVLSYLFALPFFRHSLLGDLAYTVGLFLALETSPQWVRAVRRVAFAPGAFRRSASTP